MPSVLSSQSVFLAAAMAASGAVIYLSLCRHRAFPTTQLMEDQSPKPPLRSCLSSGETKKKKKKKKKRVRFADGVKVVDHSGPLIRRQHRNRQMNKVRKIDQPCREEISDVHKGMPENRVALYHGILRDRAHVHRMDCSY